MGSVSQHQKQVGWFKYVCSHTLSSAQTGRLISVRVTSGIYILFPAQLGKSEFGAPVSLSILILQCYNHGYNMHYVHAPSGPRLHYVCFGDG